MSAEKPSSRREFLQGRAAARALADKAKQAIDAATGRALRCDATNFSPAQHTKHLVASRRAMACDFEVQYHAADGPNATDAILAALGLIERLEDQLSIYRDHTEVSAVNRGAAAAPVSLELRLFQLIQLCEWLERETNGAFDITSGPMSRIWGFLRREGRIPEQSEIDAALEIVGGELWQLDEESRSIEFLRRGVEINFNSIGKGYALDRAAELLGQRGIGDYLWHGGRSSVLARGANRAGSRDGWTVGIPHPLEPGKRLAEVTLSDCGLGTAGSATQYFEYNGRRYGHIVDPRTGWPAEGVFSATAIAATAAEADALATAFYVLGPGGAAEYCATHSDVRAVLVCPGQGDAAVALHAFNLADDQWRPRPI